VVIAGRPNVGKSALFNKLYQRRQAIVHDLPGMTRDVLEVDARLPDDRAFRLVDTGGYDPSGKEKMPAAIREKAVAAIRGADLVLLVMDASAGVLPGDRAAARVVRESGRECLVVANKIDRREGSEGESEAWALGFPEVLGVSAEHGIGVDDIQDAIGKRLAGRAASNEARPEVGEPDAEGGDAETQPEREIAVAVVGRPNVGKSSLLNALLGEPRAIVSEVAGTTRDSVDASLDAGDHRFRLVDTAGIRRRGRTERGPRCCRS
jgi:GTP-binding protein